MENKNNILVLVLALVAALCFGIITVVMDDNKENVEINENDAILYGSSINFSNQTDKIGIKFCVSINKSKYDALSDPIVSLLVTPLNKDEKEITVKNLALNNDYYQGYISIKNAPFQKQENDFSVKVKITAGGIKDFVSKTYEVSIYKIAQSALNDNNGNYTKEEKQFLENLIAKANNKKSA